MLPSNMVPIDRYAELIIRFKVQLGIEYQWLLACGKSIYHLG